MSDSNRPRSRWSTSMSITTKSTGSTGQTIPLINVRKKLFRQSANSQKILTRRMTKSKHDIEELFKLYYSNDIKFDTFQRQIVTGTRISTTRQSSLSQNNLTNSSTTIFNSKHCVSREPVSNTNSDCNETTTTTKSPSTKRAVQIRIENNVIMNSSVPSSNSNRSASTTIPVIPKLIIKSSSAQQDELCDSSLVKSLAFLGDISGESHENLNTKNNKSNNSQSPKSSLLTLTPGPPPPSLLEMNEHNNNRQDPTVLSHSSFSTITSMQQQSQPAIVTGSAVIVRKRSPAKQSWTKQRTKSNTTVITNSSAPPSTTKTRSSSISNPLLIQPDMSEVPVFVGTQRVVSIPSKCSRYVLVTLPEVPLRYNTPSYVERLLLPERFPTLFHNIIQSYDHHFTSHQHHRNTK